MFSPKKSVKHNPELQWKLPDRIFFGFGACHILTGVFLKDVTMNGFYAEWIAPHAGFSGTHIYATNGLWAFDYHGYVLRKILLSRYWRGQKEQQNNWDAKIERVQFSLLDTYALNKHKHRGSDQYFGDPIPRAKRFISSKKIPKALG